MYISLWKEKEMEIEYIVVLADVKNPAIKHIGKSDTLAGAKKIRNKRRIGAKQRLWIGKYVNGVLRESY
jgi:hypothetical protein